MAIEITEPHNGPLNQGEIVRFSLDQAGTLFITDQTLSNVTYSLALMFLRREQTNSDADYAVMKPDVVLDNMNNYHVLAPGLYAVKALESADVIVAVQQ